MAWLRTECMITLKDSTSGGYDDGSHTVEVYPMTDTYPTNKIACTQLASLHDYLLDSAPVANTHYWVRVDGTDVFPLFAKESFPAIGG